MSDLATAEDIVQESFTALHGMRRTLPDADAALCYLRRSVVRPWSRPARPSAVLLAPVLTATMDH